MCALPCLKKVGFTITKLWSFKNTALSRYHGLFSFAFEICPILWSWWLLWVGSLIAHTQLMQRWDHFISHTGILADLSFELLLGKFAWSLGNLDCSGVVPVYYQVLSGGSFWAVHFSPGLNPQLWPGTGVGRYGPWAKSSLPLVLFLCPAGWE